MSTPNRSSQLAAVLLSLLVPSLTLGGTNKDLGHDQLPALGQQIQDVRGSIVSPDGSGLPPGNSTVSTGKALYESRCVACHGTLGQEKGNELAGGMGSLSSSRPLRTVGSFWPYATTLYDYIARAMPYNEEKSLTVDEVYAVTAYVLYLNDILAIEASVGEKTLPGIVMPNQQGFIELYD
jgi:hypothetical protein